ncbi:MAG: site-2 protease family protein [Myxococcales bacterium]|jgi:Zn-dependent protease/predicted transcriptional regulator|nr:site-2 protease family protein [Myxococcales bacterium]
MRGSFHIATIAGIQVRIHFSLLLILPLFAYLFGAIYLNAAHSAPFAPEVSRGSAWLFGALMAVALFVSVLLHELAHSLYARAKGGQVREITLLMLGGVSQLTQMPTKPSQEALMAFFGPLSSLGLGTLSILAARLVPAASAFPAHFGLFYFGYLNIFLGVFNLLPAFPMDGGRILRALLTRPLGRPRATRVAATVGKVFAGLLFVLGLFSLNLILMLVALFVWFGAEGERQSETLQSAVEGVRIRQVMRSNPTAIPADARLEEALEAMRQSRRELLFVVEGLVDGMTARRFMGVITLERLTQRTLAQRAIESVAELTIPVKTLSPDDSLISALRVMSERDAPLAMPVVDETGALIGVLDRDEIARSLRFLEIEAQERQARERVGFVRRGEERP